MRHAVLGGALALVGVACSSSGGATASASAVASGSAGPSTTHVHAGWSFTGVGKLWTCVDRDGDFDDPAKAAAVIEKMKNTPGGDSVEFFADGCADHYAEREHLWRCVEPDDGDGHRGTRTTTTYSLHPVKAGARKKCIDAKGTWTGGTVVDGFDEIKARACSKDVAGFWKLVDQKAVIARLAKTMGVAPAIAAAGFQEASDEWTKDIDRGERGFVCAWEFVRAVPKADAGKDAPTDLVIVKLVSGDEAHLWFEKRGEAWVLVGYEKAKK